MTEDQFDALKNMVMWMIAGQIGNTTPQTEDHRKAIWSKVHEAETFARDLLIEKPAKKAPKP